MTTKAHSLMRKTPANPDDKINEAPKLNKSIMPLNKILGSKRNECEIQEKQSGLKGELRN